jgi:hypothetical protein
MPSRDKIVVIAFFGILLFGAYLISRPDERNDKRGAIVGCYRTMGENEDRTLLEINSSHINKDKQFSTFKIYEDKKGIYLLPKMSIFFYGEKKPELYFKMHGPDYYIRIDPKFEYLKVINISGSYINIYKVNCENGRR